MRKHTIHKNNIISITIRQFKDIKEEQCKNMAFILVIV